MLAYGFATQHTFVRCTTLSMKVQAEMKSRNAIVLAYAMVLFISETQC